MVATMGLTHLALDVKDPEQSFRFYQRVFGMVAVYRMDGFIQAQTPGTFDVMVFQKAAKNAGKRGGLTHFGFRLKDPRDIGKALRTIKAAGGTIREQGEFTAGQPDVFFTDPDGYEIEIMWEPPTPVDPSRARLPRAEARSRQTKALKGTR